MMNYLLKRREICDEWFNWSWEHNEYRDIVSELVLAPTWKNSFRNLRLTVESNVNESLKT